MDRVRKTIYDTSNMFRVVSFFDYRQQGERIDHVHSTVEIRMFVIDTHVSLIDQPKTPPILIVLHFVCFSWFIDRYRMVIMMKNIRRIRSMSTCPCQMVCYHLLMLSTTILMMLTSTKTIIDVNFVIPIVFIFYERKFVMKSNLSMTMTRSCQTCSIDKYTSQDTYSCLFIRIYSVMQYRCSQCLSRY
jgi:hypothetical protein